MDSYVFTTAGVTDVGGNPKKPNQDTFLAEAATGLLAVFDGHGEHGTRAAEIARDTVAAGGSFADAEAVFKAELLALPGAVAHEEAVRRYGMDVRGGTTASVVRVTGRRLVLEHVGDSEVMVVDTQSGEFTVLTKDHSSTSLAEYERAMKTCTKTPNVYFDKLSRTFGPVSHRPVFVPKEPPPTDGSCLWEMNPLGGFYVSNVRRDWAAYVALGDTMLNMFRAIGDFGLKAAGVTSEPDRVEHILPAAGRSVVIVASDGLFDPLQYKDISDCVLANKDKTAEEMSAAVLALGLTAGKKHFGSGQDNTTVCIGILDGPAHPKELCLGEPIGL
jgi:serine/threonine protein phosphatase PrpC